LVELFKENSRKFPVPIFYILEEITPLRLLEREKRCLHSISISSDIYHYALDFRIQARNLMVVGLSLLPIADSETTKHARFWSKHELIP